MARLLGHDPGRRARRRRLTRRGRYFAPASANWASSWAARKNLFLPRSPTVLMLKACLSRSASPSLTPCRALTGLEDVGERLALPLLVQERIQVGFHGHGDPPRLGKD